MVTTLMLMLTTVTQKTLPAADALKLEDNDDGDADDDDADADNIDNDDGTVAQKTMPADALKLEDDDDGDGEDDEDSDDNDGDTVALKTLKKVDALTKAEI